MEVAASLAIAQRDSDAQIAATNNEYPIARGQRIQFGIIAIISLGVFTVLYLGGCYAGKHWPVRRKQSMEYRAHPRHQEKYP